MITKKPELIPQLQLYYKTNNISIEEINIFGIDFPIDQDRDVWNDIIGIWTENNCYCWTGTTDPGKHCTETQPGGAAHMCIGYQKNIWQVGMHAISIPSFTHQALIQTGNAVKIWRDVNQNYQEDENTIESGYFGINFHRASAIQDVPTIGLYSAGCQVTLDINDFNFAMNLILNTNKYKTNPKCTFSYVLFNHSYFGM